MTSIDTVTPWIYAKYHIIGYGCPGDVINDTNVHCDEKGILFLHSEEQRLPEVTFDLCGLSVKGSVVVCPGTGGSETIMHRRRDIASSSPGSCLGGWRRSAEMEPNRRSLPSFPADPSRPAAQTPGALDAHRPPSDDGAHLRTCSLLTSLFMTKTGITGLDCRTEEDWWLN